MRRWKKMVQAAGAFLAALMICSPAVASDVGITSVQPVFDAATPNAGRFRVRVGLKNQTDKPRQVNLVCLYLGLTRPGVYVKGEPGLQKQYQVVDLKPGQMKEVVLKNRFDAWHPETIGELVVTLVGQKVVKSQPVETRFRPGSPD